MLLEEQRIVQVFNRPPCRIAIGEADLRTLFIEPISQVAQEHDARRSDEIQAAKNQK